MDDHDKETKEILDRIDYETRRRNREYLKELEDIEKRRKSDEFLLGDSHGVKGWYDKQIEQLDEDFKYKRQIDDDRYSNYWDKYAAGTYTDQFYDREKEEKLQEAENTIELNVRIHGKKIPLKVFQELEGQHGKDIHEVLFMRQKKREEGQKQKAEQDRLNELEMRKKQEQETKLAYEKEIRERFNKAKHFQEARNELTQGNKY